MGLAKLDDVEYARRARERNARLNAVHRKRLLDSGKSQTNVWLSADLRQRLDADATAADVSLSVVVERLLMDGYSARDSALANPAIAKSESSNPSPASASVFTALASEARDARMARCVELKAQGLSGYDIAKAVGCSEPTVRRALKRESAKS